MASSKMRIGVAGGQAEVDARKKSGRIRRVDVLAEAIARSRTMQQLEAEIKDFDSRSELHKQMIRNLLSDLTPVEINNLRYRLFAPHYDEHMRGHERAIRFLMRQLRELEKTFGGERLLKNRVLEASCGTGTVIELLCQEFGWKRASDFNIIANDLSEDMKEIARRKLRTYPASVTFTSQDLKGLPFEAGSFGSVIISQTIHLITDDEVLSQERARNYMHISGKRHLAAKMQVIGNALDLLEPGGTLIIIDEWPALLTDRGGPLGAGFAYLFNDGLRPIDEKALRYSVLGRMPRVKFVADVNVPIDSEHTMHLIIFKKDVRSGSEKAHMPIDRNDGERIRAAKAVLDAFAAMDTQFLESNKPENGEEPWINYLPLRGGKMLIVDETNLERIGTGHECVVLDRCVHEMEREARKAIFERAALAIDVGGSLIITAEWEPPEGSTNPLKRGVFNHMMDELSRNLIFQGELRLPIAEGYLSGMYGLHYRRVF